MRIVRALLDCAWLPITTILSFVATVRVPIARLSMPATSIYELRPRATLPLPNACVLSPIAIAASAVAEAFNPIAIVRVPVAFAPEPKATLLPPVATVPVPTAVFPLGVVAAGSKAIPPFTDVFELMPPSNTGLLAPVSAIHALAFPANISSASAPPPPQHTRRTNATFFSFGAS
ncbi:hypothetical protein C7534_13423 [Pseudomonas sp. OV226]|nr:hypothetical protein C7534_13423 [Pseudomonas sp. OV226]